MTTYYITQDDLPEGAEHTGTVAMSSPPQDVWSHGDDLYYVMQGPIEKHVHRRGPTTEQLEDYRKAAVKAELIEMLDDPEVGAALSRWFIKAVAENHEVSTVIACEADIAASYRKSMED